MNNMEKKPGKAAVKKNWLCGGVVMGLYFSILLQPYISQRILTEKYGDEVLKIADIQADTGMEEKQSVQVEYYKGFLSYGTIKSGKKTFFYLWNPKSFDPNNVKLFENKS